MPRTTEAEDLLVQIEEQARHVSEERTKLEDCKQAAKEQREAYEQAMYDLERLCRTRDEENPLIDGAEQ